MSLRRAVPKVLAGSCLVSVAMASAVALGATYPTPTSPTSPPLPKASVGYRDPSKNIQCGLKGKSVICTITRQNHTSGCKRTYTASGTVATSGSAVLNVGCFTGTPFRVSGYKTLGYGKHVTRKGVTCTMMKTGVKCTSKSKHGFKLLRSGSTTF